MYLNSMEPGGVPATLRILLSTLALALGVVTLTACDDPDSPAEAVEEAGEQLEEGAEELEDEIDDHT